MEKALINNKDINNKLIRKSCKFYFYFAILNLVALIITSITYISIIASNKALYSLRENSFQLMISVLGVELIILILCWIIFYVYASKLLGFNVSYKEFNDLNRIKKQLSRLCRIIIYLISILWILMCSGVFISYFSIYIRI